MTYIIAEPCVDVKDTACVDVCPVDCIYQEADTDRTLYIHPDECIDCAACEPVCPVVAIFTAEDTPEQWKPWIEVNALYFKDKATARTRVDQLKPRGTPPATPQH